MPIDALIREAQGMPEEAIMSAVHHLRSLRSLAEGAGAPSSPRKKRKAGILKGKLTIPASFDDPLDDFEDYM